MPRLSIIICAYNEARWLADQLRSIARQVRHTRHESDVEIVFIDDGSTDTTFAIACTFRDSLLPGMRVATLPVRCGQALKNQGCALATNYGASIAQGDFFYFASANDVMEPRAITSIFEAIEAFDSPRSAPGGLPEKSIDVIVGDVAGIHLGWGGDADGELVSPRYIEPGVIAQCFGSLGIIHAAGVVISRRAWDRHGGWDAAFWPYSETLTWHVAACRYGAVYTPNAFGWVRQHEGSASKTVLDRTWRGDIMNRAADCVMMLEEPTRSRLIGSRLWEIAEWAPDMGLRLRNLVATQYADWRYREHTGGLVSPSVVERFGIARAADCVISE